MMVMGTIICISAVYGAGSFSVIATTRHWSCAAFPADGEPALPSRVVKLSDDMLQFAEEPRPLVILDEHGHPLTAGDNARRFFEASWMHKYNGKYYFLILRETLICFAMPQEIIRMVRSLIKGLFCSLW